jgi:hypothetical protein
MEKTALPDGYLAAGCEVPKMRTFLSGDEKRISKRVPKSKLRNRVFSHEVLRRMMSEVISLREQVAQAELAVNDLVTDRALTSGVANNDPFVKD